MLINDRERLNAENTLNAVGGWARFGDGDCEGGECVDVTEASTLVLEDMPASDMGVGGEPRWPWEARNSNGLL